MDRRAHQAGPGSGAAGRGPGQVQAVRVGLPIRDASPIIGWKGFHTLSRYGTRGGWCIGLGSVGGVDMAIWDAIGQALGRPLWQLWGGYRNRLRVNIIGGYYGRDLGAIADEVAEWRAMGFRGCKFKVGGRSPKEDAERVIAARAAAGDDFVITIDANQGYTMKAPLELCQRRAVPAHGWVEEPCIWTNAGRDMRDIRARRAIPASPGQSH